jgi:hypothetical protein
MSTSVVHFCPRRYGNMFLHVTRRGYRQKDRKSATLSVFARCDAHPRWRANPPGMLVPAEGFEPPTTRLRSGCSTAELRRPKSRGHRYRRQTVIASKPVAVVPSPLKGAPPNDQRGLTKQLPQALPWVAGGRRRHFRHGVAIEAGIRAGIVGRMHQGNDRFDRLRPRRRFFS